MKAGQMPNSFDSVPSNEKLREGRLTYQASGLGLSPGTFPATLEIDVGNGSALKIDRVVFDGRALGFLYRQENSGVEVLVFAG